MCNSASGRKREGEFYTPLRFAQAASKYLTQNTKERNRQSSVYWDMCAGQGHLEDALVTHGQFDKVYLSTLKAEDVAVLKQKFPDAVSFQYDYLNGSEEELPETLRNDLGNRNKHWTVFINPPYATAQEESLNTASKTGVADTRIRQQMNPEKLGECSRELYVQFLYRIIKEFSHHHLTLGVFAPLKYLLSNNYQKFRTGVLTALTFQAGFVFSSESFAHTSRSRHFPVSFIVWNNGGSGQISPRADDPLAILNEYAEPIGTKTVRIADRSQFLSRWIFRPPATHIFPPFSSALKPLTGSTHKDVRNRVAEGFLASLMCPGNELQNQQKTAFLSGPQISAGALSVTADNFEQAMVVFAARRIPQNTWLTHVDQLLAPNCILPEDFITDCTIWSLFDNKNQTAELHDVAYQGKVYQIENHFYPFECGDAPSFVADWLSKRTLSPAAAAVLETGKKMYTRANILGLKDVLSLKRPGWYQLRQFIAETNDTALQETLNTLQEVRQHLARRVEPQLACYGITAGFSQDRRGCCRFYR